MKNIYKKYLNDFYKILKLQNIIIKNIKVIKIEL